jgi:hypothetical protein
VNYGVDLVTRELPLRILESCHSIYATLSLFGVEACDMGIVIG